MGPVRIAYLSDVLCVWAYVSHLRIEELRRKLGDEIELSHHFINTFGNTPHRIGEFWGDRGGYAGLRGHVLEVIAEFPDIGEVHPAIWADCRPNTSANAHLVLKAVQLMGGAADFERFEWSVRKAFFREARDIGRLPVLLELAEEAGLSMAKIEGLIDSGEAMAALCRDNELRDELQIAGSPSYVMNDGRQKLYGNVGYRIIEANVRELQERGRADSASWC